MSKDPEELAEGIRTLADLLDRHGESVEGLVDGFLDDGGVEMEYEEADGEEPLAEVHEIGDKVVIVSELRHEVEKEVSVFKEGDDILVATGKESLVAEVDDELDMANMSVQVNNGIIEVEIKKVEG